MKYLTLAIATFLLIVSGCGGEPSASVAEYNSTNMLRLRNAYEMYLVTHEFKGPKDESEFKNYLKNDKAANVRLGRMGIDVDKVDEIFINERDGKPFRVRYGLTGLADHAIVFEEEGEAGMRFVALATPVEVDSAKYDLYWKGEIKPVSADGMSGRDAQADNRGPSGNSGN